MVTENGSPKTESEWNFGDVLQTRGKGGGGGGGASPGYLDLATDVWCILNHVTASPVLLHKVKMADQSTGLRPQLITL